MNFDDQKPVDQDQTVRDDLANDPSGTPTIPIAGLPKRSTMSVTEAQESVGARYEIEKLAGRGGMGQVFVARDVRLERQVAIKFIDGHITDEGRIKLLNEARAMAGLRHRSICPVFEAVVDAPRPFMVMGWIDGIPLHEAWRKQDLNQRLDLLNRIIEAVAEVHEAGLAHLDIKPSNILVDRTGSPVLVDFGLACDTDASGKSQYGGTPGYSAPEQFQRKSINGQSADVHALGILLYQAMTNELPWEASSSEELIKQSTHEEPRLPEEIAPGSPWPLQRISLAAIEQVPERRYPNAQAMRMDLARYQRGETVSARPSGLMDRFHDQVRRRQEETTSWTRQGLVTTREAEMLERIYDRMQRPESHWIVDSRRLTVSQVMLYLGGWLVLLAMTIGGGFTWEAFEPTPWLRYTIPAGVCGCVLTLGVLLSRFGHPRIALGYLFTASLLTPVALALFLAEIGWLSDPGNNAQLLELILGIPPSLTNAQILICGVTLAATALAGRHYLESSAFSPLVVIGLSLSGIAFWAAVGFMADTPSGWAIFGCWLIAIAGCFLALGIPLNRHQQRIDRLEAPGRAMVFDAWAFLSGGVLLCFIGLTMTAWNSPSSYLPGLLAGPTPSPYDDAVMVISNQSLATAFIINGLILLALSWGLTLVRTIACSRLAEILRWIIPAHVLGGLIELALATWVMADEQEMKTAAAWVWLGVAAFTSLGFALASVRRQWRPFLVSGLLGLASIYVILMMRLKMEFQESPQTFDWIAISTVAGLCIVGILAMLASPHMQGKPSQK